MASMTNMAKIKKLGMRKTKLMSKILSKKGKRNFAKLSAQFRKLDDEQERLMEKEGFAKKLER